MEDYDTYIDRVAECLEAQSFNHQELKIIESCFDQKWEVNIAADLIKAYWDGEEDYNMHGDYD